MERNGERERRTIISGFIFRMGRNGEREGGGNNIRVHCKDGKKTGEGKSK
jgi:hypothetical protein